MQALAAAKSAQGDADEEARQAARLHRLALEADTPEQAEDKARYQRLEAARLEEAADARARVEAQKRVVEQAVRDRDMAALGNIALAATGERTWGEAVLSILGAALACVGLGALKASFKAVKFAANGWAKAGGIAGQGGLKSVGLAYVKNFTLSMKNLAKFAKLKFQPSTVPRIGDRRISDALYQQLRRKTPDDDLSILVNQGAPSLGAQDFALPGLKIEGPLQADHIVSMHTIARMEGFDLLTKSQQIEVLNFPDNFIGLSEAANYSKQNKSFADWLMHQRADRVVKDAMINAVLTTGRQERSDSDTTSSKWTGGPSLDVGFEDGRSWRSGGSA